MGLRGGGTGASSDCVMADSVPHTGGGPAMGLCGCAGRAVRLFHVERLRPVPSRTPGTHPGPASAATVRRPAFSPEQVIRILWARASRFGYAAIMIIWRGWGIIGFLLIGLGVAAVMGLTGQNGTDSPAGTVSLGAGLLLGGTVCSVFGYWLNVARPRQQAGGYVEDLRQDLWQRVRAGSFQVEPGAAAPRDEAEATQQVEQIVARQRPTIERRLRNRNSLFFIPLQWLGGAVALGGVVLALMGLLGTTL